MEQKNQSEVFEAVNTQQEYYYGKYWVFGKFRTNQYLFAIGPHWWVFILGFSFIFGMSMMIYLPINQFIGFWQRFAFKIILFLMLLAYFMTFLINPGILPILKNQSKLKDTEQKVKVSCQKCQTLSTINAEHCDDCDICILELDHHCVWTGKCIGKKNLILFYIFISLVPTFFVYVMFMAIQIQSKVQKKIKLKLIKNGMEMQPEIQNVISCLSNLNRQVRQNSVKEYTLNQFIDKLLNYIYIENLCIGKIYNITHDTQYHYFSDLIKMFSKVNKAYLSHLIKLIMDIGDKNLFKDTNAQKQIKDRLSLGLKTQEKLNPLLFGDIQSIYNREYLQAFEKFFDNLGFSLTYAQKLNDYQTVFKENQLKQNQKNSQKKKKKFSQKSYERQVQALNIFREIEDNCYENFNEIKDPFLLIEISKLIIRELQKDQNVDILNVIDDEQVFKQTPKEKSSTNILEEVAYSFNYQFTIISQLRNVKSCQSLESRNRALNDIIEQVYNKFLNFQRGYFKKIQKEQNEYLLKKVDKQIQTEQDLQIEQLIEELKNQKTNNEILISKLNESQSQVKFLQDYQKELQKKYNDIVLVKNQTENQNQSQIQKNLETFQQNNLMKNHLQSINRKQIKQKKTLQNFFNKGNEILDQLFFGFDQNKKLKLAIDNPNFDVQVVCDKLMEGLKKQLVKKFDYYKNYSPDRKSKFYIMIQIKSRKKQKDISKTQNIIGVKHKKNKKIKNKFRKTIYKKESPKRNSKQKKLNNFIEPKFNNRNKTKNSKQDQSFKQSKDQNKIKRSFNLKNQFNKTNPNYRQSYQNNNKYTKEIRRQFNNKITKQHKVSQDFKIIYQNKNYDNNNYSNQFNSMKNYDKINFDQYKQFYNNKNNFKKKQFILKTVYEIHQYKNNVQKKMQNFNESLVKNQSFNNSLIKNQHFNKNFLKQNLLKSNRENSLHKKQLSKSQKMFFTFRHRVSSQKSQQWKILGTDKSNNLKKSFRIQINNKNISKKFKNNISGELTNIKEYINSLTTLYQDKQNISKQKSQEQIQIEYEKLLVIYCKSIQRNDYNQKEQQYLKSKVKKLIKKFSQCHQCERGCNHDKLFLERLSKLQLYLKNRQILKLPKYNITGQFLLQQIILQ